MVTHADAKTCIIYPENSHKALWDVFMAVVLCTTCFLTPLHIAFEDNSVGFTVLNYFIDGLFLVDIFVIFCTAYYTEDFELVDDHKEIAKSYLQGWFMIDFLAIIPV